MTARSSVDPAGAFDATAFPSLESGSPRIIFSPVQRAIQGAVGSLVFGLVMAIPDWYRSRRVVPPKPVIRGVAQFAAESAASAFIESSVEIYRGKTGNAVAPIIGLVTPRLVAVSVSSLIAFKKGEKIDWKAKAKQTAAALAMPIAQELLFRRL